MDNLKEVLNDIRKKPEILQYRNDAVKLNDNREHVLMAVTVNGVALKYIDKKYREDYEIVHEAVKKCGWMLQFAAPGPRSDLKIVKAAYKQDKRALWYVSESIRQDKCLLAQIVGDDESIIEESIGQIYKRIDKEIRDKHSNGLPYYLQEDQEILNRHVTEKLFGITEVPKAFVNSHRELTLECMRKINDSYGATGHHLAFQGIMANLSDELRDDEEFIKVALEGLGENIRYASERLRDDKAMALIAINNGFGIKHPLQYLSDRLRDDEEIVIDVVSKNGIYLMYASERLRDDERIVGIAVKENRNAIKYASERLRKQFQI